VSHLIGYLEEIQHFKKQLFSLYAASGAELGQNMIPRAGGTTWGYRLIASPDNHGHSKMTGTSIGEDEIRIFYDLCQLIRPRRSMVIGNGFGLSTLAIGLAWPKGEVVALDNWSEGKAGLAACHLSEQVVREGCLEDRVRIHTGSSPQDIPAALHPWASHGKPMLALAFIDGMHTNHAAAADFNGLRPYLDKKSVVLWHNVHKTKTAFEEAANAKENVIWNQAHVLRTYGPLGIFFHAEEHPLLLRYLLDSTLIWNDWLRYLRAFSQVESTISTTPGLRLALRQQLKRLLRKIREL
jgi:predicted O-methyltransferase YrrM